MSVRNVVRAVGGLMVALALAGGSASPLEATQSAAADSLAPLPGGLLVERIPDPPTVARPKSPAEIAREGLPTVVEVVTYRASGERLGGGSGFVVAPEGLIVTSQHVLEGASRAEVVLHSGDVFEVIHVTAADQRRDLAVLRIGGFRLPTARLGDSRQVEPGDAVVVIGSPLGLTNTVSHGLVSAKRDFDGRRVLQISAPISSGSSGGPVFDDHGRVVGVLAGFFRRGQNVNFAVPIEYARGLLALPAHAFTVESVGRKRVPTLDGRASARDLSLQAVLRGESIPGEEQTPWALQPRRVDADRVKERPVSGPADLVGLWEVRELSRVPGTRSGVYRGALASDGAGLKGSFFGRLVRYPEVEDRFDADRVRELEVRLGSRGSATITGRHGCSYYVHASESEMAGVYECVDDRGTVYDVGAVEVRRITGTGPSGVYSVTEETTLGSRRSAVRGSVVVFALPDGRWLGHLMTEDGRQRRVQGLEDGRWTADGYLSARLHDRERVRGRFTERGLELRYDVGGADYPGEATLRGARVPDVLPETFASPSSTEPEREVEEDEALPADTVRASETSRDDAPGGPDR